MSTPSRKHSLSRRTALAGIGASSLMLAQQTATALADSGSSSASETNNSAPLNPFSDVSVLQSDPGLQAGDVAATAGFHDPGDGGQALYRIEKLRDDTQPNELDVISLKSGLVAVLIEREAVNYRMFGAVGDGQQDDGIPIKQAHEYARLHHVPIVNLSGEFWIKQTNDIPITTNVHWGQTRFHIDERYNAKRKPRFVVLNDQPSKTLTLTKETKAALLEQIRPGVQIIPELAAYAGHLFSVVDENDRIGVRAGANYSRRGWAREELFYVEEEGRILGDIAWQFKDFTSVTARPCNDNYLVIEGGGFYLSGDTPVGDSPGYYQNGFSIQRSRTIIREQWMGLEPGEQDMSLEPRSGFYNLRNVYDVTLENIRAMPWEKNRRDPAKKVKHGTYGIGGGRMLNCTFRNLTAEAGWVSWGVFGTNLNKNFRLENCSLNRVDVHFHCWNLYISNCTIGFKGITVTGGGELMVENTTRHGNSFISFRRDYGAKWDGHIHLRNCKLKPSNAHGVSVLSYRPADFDYQYPIGFARSVKIEDLVIDYSAVPESKAHCWLMDIVSFSKTKTDSRLFFPARIEFRNIFVEGREDGVRLIRVQDPYHYELRRGGDYDGIQLKPNCTLICEHVQLEALTPKAVDDTEQMHLSIGGPHAGSYADPMALYPQLRFTDCENVCVCLQNCIASACFERCTINIVHAPNVRGELAFNACHLQPRLSEAGSNLYAVTSTLGTRFTNCTIHTPVIGKESDAAQLDQISFWELNESLQHYHLNTGLGNDVLHDLRERGIVLSPEFIGKLQSHHPLLPSK